MLQEGRAFLGLRDNPLANVSRVICNHLAPSDKVFCKESVDVGNSLMNSLEAMGNFHRYHIFFRGLPMPSDLLCFIVLYLL